MLLGCEKYEDYPYELIVGDIQSQLEGAGELLEIQHNEGLKQNLIR